jgi:hypothetical protein
MEQKYPTKINLPQEQVDDFLDIFLMCSNCNQKRGAHLGRKKCLYGPGEFKELDLKLFDIRAQDE